MEGVEEAVYEEHPLAGGAGPGEAGDVGAERRDEVGAAELLVLDAIEVGGPGDLPAAGGAAQDLLLLVGVVDGAAAGVTLGAAGAGFLGGEEALAAGVEGPADLVDQVAVVDALGVGLVEPADMSLGHAGGPADAGVVNSHGWGWSRCEVVGGGACSVEVEFVGRGARACLTRGESAPQGGRV